MADLPTGTVTFLFTDIEGSTALLSALGDRYVGLLTDHDRLLRKAVVSHGGHEVDHPGDGFFFAFPSARGAVDAAVQAQRDVHAHEWPDGTAVRVRMGLHTGDADRMGPTYVGLDVHRAARIGAAAHGGQIVLSDHTRRLVETALPAGAELVDLGYHRLKDLAEDERLHQLSVAGLPDRFPALRGQSAPGNLPAMPTGFVGREREVAAVLAALERPDVRLLSLTGPGGSGKTRVALEAATRCADRFDAGAFFVPLATVTDPDMVASTIAEALGLREIGDRPAIDLLKRHLRDRRALLILDNFEQVHAAATLVTDLLAAAPELRVLVTSRSALHVYGEHEAPLRPMAVPPPNADARTIAASDAVQLFVQRAAAVSPGFALTPENASAIAAVVARIDGLPLAIELAAPRVRILSPRELAERLASRLPLLTGGASDLPDRQRTLRATVDWSHQLLDPAEQALFRRLSCFVGGCTVESAAAVADPAQELPFDMLQGIASLVDQSLLWRHESGAGVTRFHMLETLREYASEQLDVHDETEATRRRHAHHYLAWAESRREALDAGDVGLLDRFDEEHDNVLAALDWSIHEADGGELALRLVTAMAWYWYTRGHAQVAALWLERALDHGANASAALRAKPLYWYGAILDRRGDLERARTAMTASVEAWRTVGDREKLATALNGLGSVAENQGDRASAKAAYEESLAGYQSLGSNHGVATVLSGLGTLALAEGDVEQAERRLAEGLRRFTAEEDSWSIAVIEAQLAWVKLERGRLEEAAALAHDATGRFRQWGEQSYLAVCLDLHAAIAAPTRPRAAARFLGAASALRDVLGVTLPERERRDLERHLAPARAVLAGAFEEHVAAGMAAALDEVLDEALAAAAPQAHGRW